MFKLVDPKNRVIFQSEKKIDVIYKHQEFRRSERIHLVEPKK